jgi:SH3-like domain-containing protein
MKKTLSIDDHRSSSPGPVQVKKGERLISCEERRTQWKGWLWCQTADGTEGWIPKSYISSKGGCPTMTCDYDATELNIEKGETIAVITTESGWALCEKMDGTRGWLPLEVLEL